MAESPTAEIQRIETGDRQRQILVKRRGLAVEIDKHDMIPDADAHGNKAVGAFVPTPRSLPACRPSTGVAFSAPSSP